MKWPECVRTLRTTSIDLGNIDADLVRAGWQTRHADMVQRCIQWLASQPEPDEVDHWTHCQNRECGGPITVNDVFADGVCRYCGGQSGYIERDGRLVPYVPPEPKQDRRCGTCGRWSLEPDGYGLCGAEDRNVWTSVTCGVDCPDWTAKGGEQCRDGEVRS